MRIEDTVEVDAPIDQVWALVNDIPRIAPCMPGAALTSVVDDRTYEGTVAVKLGPLRMSYKGTVVVEETDEASHSARLAASGKDTKGAGTARATVTTRLEPTGAASTRLIVSSDVQLTGRVASFGRGGAINDVASKLFGQFAECLRTTLVTEPAAAGGPTATAAAASGAAAAADPEAATSPAGTSPAGTTAATGTEPDAGTPTYDPAPAAPTPPPAAPPVPAARPVEAGSLILPLLSGLLKSLVRGLVNLIRRLTGRRGT